MNKKGSRIINDEYGYKEESNEFDKIQSHLIESLNEEYDVSKYFIEIYGVKEKTWKNKKLSNDFKFMYLSAFYDITIKIHEENNIEYPEDIKKIIKTIKMRKVKNAFI
ncbi:hypothetical protein CPT_MarsHill_136 [Staphylococcus phage MarsHill]|nr:hypothetical protein CPT_MarsHill_136 [Staphylococcus phage MarsHill]QQO92788.1 hypothetical protein CPT_Madawaska_135 [Staphylococcus phage Madawaska]